MFAFTALQIEKVGVPQYIDQQFFQCRHRYIGHFLQGCFRNQIFDKERPAVHIHVTVYHFLVRSKVSLPAFVFQKIENGFRRIPFRFHVDYTVGRKMML